MASYINRGESVFFQFRNGKSVLNSQCKPRMFKTAEKATLGVNYVDTDDIVEYAEQKHGRWETEMDDMGWLKHTCPNCGYVKRTDIHVSLGWNYCPICGTKMDLEG